MYTQILLNMFVYVCKSHLGVYYLCVTLCDRIVVKEHPWTEHLTSMSTRGGAQSFNSFCRKEWLGVRGYVYSALVLKIITPHEFTADVQQSCLPFKSWECTTLWLYGNTMIMPPYKLNMCGVAESVAP